ncbi:NAD-dependent epimerase/dehydratase family protein [Actinomadura miaoliensis]|uniref:NAD-dependent epimerase/dehydratase family protein n=1 Tax=Actinomadura miaoliensis TaxID=430685 RepID=A0ABP7VPY4_9ACTN
MASSDTGRWARPLVVVLGASGFVGSVVTAALADRPVRLRAVARRPSAVPTGCLADVEVRRADLTQNARLADAVEGADAVIHLVAGGEYGPGRDGTADAERVNVGVMASLLDAMRGRRPGPPPAVLFAGAIHQVGVPPRTVLDGSEHDAPSDLFARHKQAAERMLLDATAEGAVRGVSLRLPPLYGHSPATGALGGGALAVMIRRALAGEPLTLWGDGTVRRDLLHVRDAAAAFLAALDHVGPLAGRHWLLGTGEGVPLERVFGCVAEIAAACRGGRPVPVRRVPPPPHAGPADLASVVVDASAFRGRTGWRPRVRLREGLEQTIMAAMRPARPAAK